MVFFVGVVKESLFVVKESSLSNVASDKNITHFGGEFKDVMIPSLVNHFDYWRAQ